MDAVTATVQMTAREFLALPEDPYGRRAQLVEGELVMNEPTWSDGQKATRSTSGSQAARVDGILFPVRSLKASAAPRFSDAEASFAAWAS